MSKHFLREILKRGNLVRTKKEVVENHVRKNPKWTWYTKLKNNNKQNKNKNKIKRKSIKWF